MSPGGRLMEGFNKKATHLKLLGIIIDKRAYHVRTYRGSINAKWRRALSKVDLDGNYVRRVRVTNESRTQSLHVSFGEGDYNAYWEVIPPAAATGDFNHRTYELDVKELWLRNDTSPSASTSYSIMTELM